MDEHWSKCSDYILMDVSQMFDMNIQHQVRADFWLYVTHKQSMRLEMHFVSSELICCHPIHVFDVQSIQ